MNKREIQAYPENWKEIDHPFYKLVADLLDGKGAVNFVEETSLVPEDEFWKGIHPKEIVIATGSTIKSLSITRVLNSIETPFNKQMDLQHFLVNNIHNGDGSLKKKTFLGEVHGVPVFAESASPGETEGNNPKQEAMNKAAWLANQPQYKDGNYLIISTDTVDFVDLNKDGQLSDGEHGLGKPMNNPSYPSENKLMESSNRFLKSVGQKIYNWQKKFFDKKYTKENFIPGADLVHTNAISILEVLANGEPQAFDVWEAIIKSTLNDQFFDNYDVVPDQGGGGAFQQNLDWDSASNIFLSLDDETQEILRAIAESDPDFFKSLVLSQIVGMPVMNILYGIEQWVLSKQQESSPDVNEEVVVFQSKGS